MKWKSVLLVRLAILLFLVVPLAAWYLVKPVRVLAPTVVGVACPTSEVCIDDVRQLDRASALYREARNFVAETIASPKGTPRVIFCSTESCANSFGLGARSAVTVGTFGTVIGPRAWRTYYVRHEIIHHLQAERLGVFRLLFKPSWLVEGMAYALSEDPREPLAEPFETYRQEFRKWFRTMEKSALWDRAAKI